MKTITLCSSANFYKHVCEIADELEATGYKTIIPLTARKMRETGDYDAAHYRTWHVDPNDYHKKTALMNDHFKEVENSDAILVVNDEKRGIKGYIGANVLMEMALAYYLKKPIFILNEVSEDSNIYEEVKAMGCVILEDDLSKVKL